MDRRAVGGVRWFGGPIPEGLMQGQLLLNALPPEELATPASLQSGVAEAESQSCWCLVSQLWPTIRERTWGCMWPRTPAADPSWEQ
ncbi:hypothetical protein MHYP_G00019180 [Metynnis hypsauchen]